MPKLSDSYYDGEIFDQICWYCNGNGERYEGSRCPICYGSGILEFDEDGKQWSDDGFYNDFYDEDPYMYDDHDDDKNYDGY